MAMRKMVVGLAMVLCADAGAASRMELFERESGRLVLLGAVREQDKGERYTRTTRVCLPDGTPVVEERVVFVGPEQLSGRVHQVDLRHGTEEILELDEKELRLAIRKSRKGELEKKRTARPSGCIAPEALPQFVRAGWTRLLAGETLEPILAVAEEGRLVKFRLAPVRREPTADGGVLVLKMEPDSWLYRRFVSPVFVRFALAPPHRLVRTEGLTNYRDEDGERLDLRIVYSVVPEAELPCRK